MQINESLNLHPVSPQKARLLLAGILAAGLLLRVYLVLTRLYAINADEAVIGLMARHILQGRWMLFHYGQMYYGPVESYLGALLLPWLGATPLVLTIWPVLFSLLFVLSTYFLARTLYSVEVGLYSALFAAISPSLLTVRELRVETAFVMILGAGSLMFAIHAGSFWKPAGRWVAILALFLLGFWAHPVMGFYALALAVDWLASRSAHVSSPAAKPDARIGSLKKGRIILWLAIATAAYLGLAWLSESRFWHGFELAQNLRFLFWFVVPAIWGLYQPAEVYGQFPVQVTPAEVVQYTVVGLAALLLTGLTIWVGVQRFRRGDRLLFIFMTLTLVIYLNLVFFGRVFFDSPIPLRYISPLYSLVPLATLALLYFTRRSRFLRLGATGTLVMVYLVGNLAIQPVHQSPEGLYDYYIHLPGKQYVYTDYWTGYWLAFVSGENVIPAVIGQSTAWQNRYPPYLAQVEAATTVQFILYTHSPAEQTLLEYLNSHSIRYQQTQVNGYSIYSGFSQRPRLTFP